MKRFDSDNFTAKNAEELKEQVESQLRDYGCTVSQSDEPQDILRYFNDGCAPEDASTADDLNEDEEQRIVVYGEPQEGCNYEPQLTAVITSHYTDPGSDMYVYTVKVYEA